MKILPDYNFLKKFFIYHATAMFLGLGSKKVFLEKCKSTEFQHHAKFLNTTILQSDMFHVAATVCEGHIHCI